MSRPQLIDIVSFDILLLHYSGFYPLKKSKLFYFARFISITFSILMMASLTIRMILDIKDLTKVINEVQFIMTQFAFLCKAFPFILRNKLLTRMIKLLETPVFNSQTAEQDKLIFDVIRRKKLFSKVFRRLMITAVSFYICFPFFDKRLLAVPAWFPVDIVKYQYYLIAFQSFCFIINAYSNCSIDMIMIGMICLMCAQLDILKNNLMNITNIENGVTQEEAEEIINKRLHDCVIHHDKTLKFISLIEDMFSLGVLMQFFASILTICLTCLLLAWTPVNSTSFVPLVLFLIVVLNQIILCCWFGHNIMIRGEDLIKACYMSNWYNYSPKLQRNLFMIMECSKRTVKLTAGKICDLNLSTFVTILRSSYSYYAVLQRVYKDK